jgi:hypothetical protein
MPECDFVQQTPEICSFGAARLMQINAQLTHGLLQELTLQNLKRAFLQRWKIVSTRLL